MSVVATVHEINTQEVSREASGATAQEPLRFITAASLFDGHDASINIMRRILQDAGVEIVHLGHNRGAEEVVRAALQEDADGIALSSYQGGHVEYFKFMMDLLRENDAEHIRIFGGGGGVIIPEEIQELHEYGVERIYSPDDGRLLGLEGMIQDMIKRVRTYSRPARSVPAPHLEDPSSIAQVLTAIEGACEDSEALDALKVDWQKPDELPPVIGITGPGGSGKSSLTDELLVRFMDHFPDIHIGILSIDPTKRRTGGALLGDRIRMNSLINSRLFMRSMATRRSHLATSASLSSSIELLQATGFDLIIVETAGIGQSDSEIVDLVDFSVYVMTSEYGAASQLEKIDMLDFANAIALNKFEKRGSLDALRDVKRQWRRNHQAFEHEDEAIPVFPTIASQFQDPGVNRLFDKVCQGLAGLKRRGAPQWWTSERSEEFREPSHQSLIPNQRQRYLSEISEQGRALNNETTRQAQEASLAQSFYESLSALEDPELPAPLEYYSQETLSEVGDVTLQTLRQRYNAALQEVGEESIASLRGWPKQEEAVVARTYSYKVRGKEISGENYSESLSHQWIPKIALPRYKDWGDVLRFLRQENLPGGFPYTAGLYPYKRTGEDPTRMFAGEGTPERTNRRFHYVSLGQPAVRLSTAFDSVTLYGEDPHRRPDIYGKVGNSGVSICTVDDMKKLYSGFDLCARTTSVSMTINGPAPMILAFFMNTAIDQQVEKYLKERGEWEAACRKRDELLAGKPAPRYQGELPEGNDGFGLGTLGISGLDLVDVEVYEKIKADTLARVRGTVQADILKEDQAQNTCIFSTEFALRMMGDIQEYFIEKNVRNYYSVSISGYHIAEAGANPVTQLALTLANGFTLVEYYLSRGMDIDTFAPNLSFFFSNGLDPEYAVIGRVARRIWARAMRYRYEGNSRSQMLKYHIQTSGRSLHAQEIQFNDIRTTLQALYAIYDNCNSLHTNAYDEAITTPTEESVRRAMAIQLIINRELGLTKNENPLQGAFIVDELTDLVEEAVYAEFDRLTDRGGVLGAMETMYQRGKIQEESLHYEGLKHSGGLPVVGVNTFMSKDDAKQNETTLELIRSTEEEKNSQIDAVKDFSELHGEEREEALKRLQEVAKSGGNIFAELMETVKSASLGQISHGLYQVGGQYRRNM